MHLLYLDDSGSPGNINEKNFVLGGFIIQEKNLYWVNQRLDELAKKYGHGQGDDVEFHASEIAGGRSAPWNSIRVKQERIEVIKEVLAIAADGRNDIKILSCAIDKSAVHNGDPVAIAFEDLCSRFHYFLKKQYHANKDHGGNGLIILDESSHETTLQELARNFRTLGTKWGFTTNNIQEVPLFVNSKASRCIQLADHIAYSVFRRYEHGDLNCYNVIEGYFDADGERMHGLCHKTNNVNCTCPHCIQKKYPSKGQ